MTEEEEAQVGGYTAPYFGLIERQTRQTSLSPSLPQHEDDEDTGLPASRASLIFAARLLKRSLVSKSMSCLSCSVTSQSLRYVSGSNISNPSGCLEGVGWVCIRVRVKVVQKRIVTPEAEARGAHIFFASSLIGLIISTKSGAASAWTIHGCIGRGVRVLKSS